MHQTDITNNYHKIPYKTLLPISLVLMISLLFFITSSDNFVYALVMRGTQGNDNLSGTPKDDSVEGLRGNDNMGGLKEMMPLKVLKEMIFLKVPKVMIT